ncbi:MAG: hypothetical protein MJZ16_03060 [Bacteroidales bacterium]|nr:hypothetical protein [Bacteroidales bacterium]
MKRNILALVFAAALMVSCQNNGNDISTADNTLFTPQKNSSIYYVMVSPGIVGHAFILYGDEEIFVYDKNDNPIEFQNSSMALNYLGSNGWDMVSTEKIGDQVVYLLKFDSSKHKMDPVAEYISQRLSDQISGNIEKDKSSSSNNSSDESSSSAAQEPKYMVLKSTGGAVKGLFGSTSSYSPVLIELRDESGNWKKYSVEETLNYYSAKGWELVTTFNDNTDMVYFVLKQVPTINNKKPISNAPKY